MLVEELDGNAPYRGFNWVGINVHGKDQFGSDKEEKESRKMKEDQECEDWGKSLLVARSNSSGSGNNRRPPPTPPSPSPSPTSPLSFPLGDGAEVGPIAANN
ncbi:hypothetical protein HZH66_007551 [Vespula vulgaris]|uniref:Uncharacterized protein n=1 Tax=Vespula vulgaris TaxID=7454 RepID=A0A834K121_VESVU|nr:hypothetical protein HZH66_007551 [Vespula vulgaris]